MCVVGPYQGVEGYWPNLTSAGAMAAPILLASLMPLSTTLPTVTRATWGPGRISLVTTTAPEAVAVHWAVGVRWQPYSRGVRYWRSAEQKWEEVTACL